MDIKFNPEFHRYEVYGQKSVVRAGEEQPVFVTGEYEKAAEYLALAGMGKSMQRSRILQHLLVYGSTTARELWELYGIGSPRKRISELRKSPHLEKLGYQITDRIEEGHNRFWEPTRYKRYVLEEI